MEVIEQVPWSVLTTGTTAITLLIVTLIGLWRGWVYVKPQVMLILAQKDDEIARERDITENERDNARHWRQAHAVSEEVRVSAIRQVEELTTALDKLADQGAVSVEVMKALREVASHGGANQD